MNTKSVRDQLQSIGVMPHQVEFVESVSIAPKPARFSLAAPSGYGKSIAMAAVIKALSANSNGTYRCLTIVPASLQDQWASVLHDWGSVNAVVVNGPEYRRLQAETPLGQNPWATRPYIITYIDFLKMDERVDEVLNAPMDVILFDELHQSGHRSLRSILEDRI